MSSALRISTINRELNGRLQLLGRTVVDAGCHEGAWWDWMLSKKVSSILALDRHPRPENIPAKITYQQLDLDVQRPEIQAHVVFAFGLLYHLLDPIGFLIWAARTAPVVVLETAIMEGDEPIYRLIQESPDSSKSGPRSHALIPTERALVESLRAAGLDLKRMFPMNGFNDAPMRRGVYCERKVA